MYLRKATIEHIKGLSKVEMAFEEGREAGWHVILGDNGSGKTTLIRAVALALLGPQEATALQQTFENWPQGKEPSGTIAATIRVDALDAHSVTPKPGRHTAKIQLNRAPHPNPIEPLTTGSKNLLWGRRQGWFSASFGPGRFLGKTVDTWKASSAPAARHFSVFEEVLALVEAQDWLVQAHKKKDADLIEKIKGFINQPSTPAGRLLPHDVQLHEVHDEGARFKGADGTVVEASELAGGYRSILSLVFELLNRLNQAYGGWGSIFDAEGNVGVPGVVMFDEVDVHLHPSWQVSIGEWFKARFPRIQFITATHSPLVCRAIGEHGKVFRLRAPGNEGPQLTEIIGVERDMLWYGSLHKALSSPAFGLSSVTRSPFSQARLEVLGRLNRDAFERDLTREEEDRRAHLQSVLSDDRRIVGQG